MVRNKITGVFFILHNVQIIINIKYNYSDVNKIYIFHTNYQHNIIYNIVNIIESYNIFPLIFH